MCTPQHTITGQCIDEHIHHLACILNIFIEHLIGGRGRYINVLLLVEGELETLWEESLTIPTCFNCLANIVTLMDLVIRAYRVPRPRFHCNISTLFSLFYVIYYEKNSTLYGFFYVMRVCVLREIKLYNC